MNILDKVAMEKIEFAPESIRAKLLEIDSLVEQSKKETGIKKIETNKVLLEQLIALNNDPLFIQFKEERLTEKAENGEAVRKNTSQFYVVRTKGEASRQALNNAAWDALQRCEQPGYTPTEKDKEVLARYTGCGGNLKNPLTGRVGSSYEYYTPKPIAEGVWDVMQDLGYKGGKILDPSAGSGIFGATAPLNSIVEAVELSPLSAKVNKIINGGTGYNVVNKPFEVYATSSPDNEFDAVVTNVPFGTAADRGSNAKLDPKYQNYPLECYFILRSLQKLRPNGMAAFIAPTGCMDRKDGKYATMRQEICQMAEFVGAYRLPNGTFSTADTDVATDVLFFKKFNEETLEKINSLNESNIPLLIESNVYFQDFINGIYFKTPEGVKYVLGNIEDAKNRFGQDVEKVVYTGNILSEFKDLIKQKRLPKSRIKWDLLETAETEIYTPIDGDFRNMNGAQYEYKDGKWVLRADTEERFPYRETLKLLSDPYAAFESGVSYKSAIQARDNMMSCGLNDGMPSWAQGVFFALRNIAAGSNDGERQWKIAVIAMACDYVVEENGVGLNYLETFPELSLAITTLKKKDKKYFNSTCVSGPLTKTFTYFNKKEYPESGFSPFWRGAVEKEAKKTKAVIEASMTDMAKIEALRYETKNAWLTIEEGRDVLGDSFDPLTRDDFCINSDGKEFIASNDFFVGNIGAKLRQIDAFISRSNDEKIKSKLLRMKDVARSKMKVVDVKKLEFDLLSPFVSAEEKVEFLKKMGITQYAKLSFNPNKKTNFADIETPGKTNEEKLLNCLGDYIRNGKLTIGKYKFDDWSSEYTINRLRTLVNQTNQQFNVWVHGNSQILDRLNRFANNPDNQSFQNDEDESDINIPGLKLNPDGTPAIKLHGYQAAFVRKMGQSFSGINGFGVGLGKTFTALAAVQHTHAIGVKKKTVFVVPSAVLSNWKKETDAIFEDTSDCLYVGLRFDKKGKGVVKSATYPEDLQKIKENRHSKIFMTQEAFQGLRLKEETISNYLKYMEKMDDSFEVKENSKGQQSEKSQQRVNAKLGQFEGLITKKKEAYPYLEELSIDSIVMDEAHSYKNSSMVFEDMMVKDLALSEPSYRGMDAQIKCWYIRGMSDLNDGVLLLTATPITNSPLEIYSMLSLTVGNQEMNTKCLGAKGATAFIRNFADINNEETETIDNRKGSQNVYVGLKNLEILRTAVLSVATIKTAQDVGAKVHIPKAETNAVTIKADQADLDQIKRYKAAYQYAKIAWFKSNNKENSIPASLQVFDTPENKLIYEAVQRETGEPDQVLSSPFNLIDKMNKLLLDPDLQKNVTSYYFDEYSGELAEKVMGKFNAQGLIVKVKYVPERVSEVFEDHSIEDKIEASGGYNRKIVTDTQTGEYSYEWSKKARADYGGNAADYIELNTNDPKAQSKFEEIAEKMGLSLNVKLSPKLASFIKNFKTEYSHPRGDDLTDNPSKIVKQIVFCDFLGMHNKIKKALQKRVGVPSGKIAIVTGQTNNSAEEILNVQLGFNGQGEENQYSTIIANKKAEVGINLQKGTQAIHHLTIGWTPDSIEQRNGRGARQGNKTDFVNIYFYDTEGTYDVVKRALVNKKGNWINSLLHTNANKVQVSAGKLSDEDLDLIINSNGDASVLNKIEARQAERERTMRINNTRQKQMTDVRMIVQNTRFLEENKESAIPYIASSVEQAWQYRMEMIKAIAELEKDKTTKNPMSESRRKKFEYALKSNEIKFKSVLSTLNSSADLNLEEKNETWDNYFSSLEDYFKSKYGKKELQVPGYVERCISGKDFSWTIWNRTYKITPKENSPIVTKWKQDIQTAESMRNSAQESFTKASANDLGAFPAEVLSKVDAKEFVFTQSGTLIVKDSFVPLTNGEFGLAWFDSHGDRGWVVLDPESGNAGVTKWDSPTIVLKDIAYPGSDRHEEFMKKSAAMEDSLSKKGIVLVDPYSKFYPAIKNYRKEKTTLRIRRDNAILPSPLFAYAALTNEDAKNSPVVSLIVKEQEPYLIKVDTDYVYTISEEIEEAESPIENKTVVKALIDYSICKGIKLQKDDFSLVCPYYGYYRWNTYLNDYIQFDSWISNIDGDSIEELKQNFLKYLTEKLPFMEVTSSMVEDYDYQIKNKFHTLQLLKEQQKKQEKMHEGKYNGSDVYNKIAIVGNTYAFKDMIKETQAAVGDGRAKFVYTNASGTEGAWIVSAIAWNTLLENNPDAEENLKWMYEGDVETFERRRRY